MFPKTKDKAWTTTCLFAGLAFFYFTGENALLERVFGSILVMFLLKSGIALAFLKLDIALFLILPIDLLLKIVTPKKINEAFEKRYLPISLNEVLSWKPRSQEELIVKQHPTAADD